MIMWIFNIKKEREEKKMSAAAPILSFIVEFLFEQRGYFAKDSLEQPKTRPKSFSQWSERKKLPVGAYKAGGLLLLLRLLNTKYNIFSGFRVAN